MTEESSSPAVPPPAGAFDATVYESREARHRALHFGMWLFLGSETLLFAGLFGLYAGYRSAYPAQFSIGIGENDVQLGTANTLLLIVSSFFVAWSIHALRGDRRKACMASLAAAMLLGAAFLGIKSIEYGHHLAEGLAPGAHGSSRELTHQGVQTFVTLYYAMTGLHALHVVAGLVILSWLVLRVWRRRTNAGSHAELELGGLYWHLVDVVWIFLWPLLYLMR